MRKAFIKFSEKVKKSCFEPVSSAGASREEKREWGARGFVGRERLGLRSPRAQVSLPQSSHMFIALARTYVEEPLEKFVFRMRNFLWILSFSNFFLKIATVSRKLGQVKWSVYRTDP